MDMKFSPEQFLKFAKQIEKRYKENPSIFSLTNPPSHAMSIGTSPSINVTFNSKDYDGQHAVITAANHNNEFVAKEPGFPHLFQHFKFRRAYKILWNIAEDMMAITSPGDKLLYELFPETLEEDLKNS